MSADEEAQQDEMLAMENIFNANIFQEYPGEIRSGQIKIELQVPDPFYIVVNMNVKPDTPDDEVLEGAEAVENETKYKIEYLPPLLLHFTLPKNYPSQAKPNFTLSTTWLHRASLSILCKKLDQVWEETKGMGVLFGWTNYLQENALSDLGISDCYNVSWLQDPLCLKKSKNKTARKSVLLAEAPPNPPSCSDAPQDNQPSEDVGETSDDAEATTEEQSLSAEPGSSKSRRRKRKLKKLKSSKLVFDPRAASDVIPRKEGKDVVLLDHFLFYSEEKFEETFIQSSYACSICFTLKLGHECVRFQCGHVFCEECVFIYYESNITEGNVDQVKCLEFKCKIRPSPERVKKIVGETIYERYDQILLKRALENMADITYCPRPKCHNPVIFDSNEKCAVCSVCSYTFCSACKLVYHGVEPCRFKDADMKELFRKYTEGSAEEKQAVVRAYGEKQLKVLVQNVLSEQWINNESKPCPHCKVPIEKFEGCNKVTCFKCNTYFCWICLKHLEQGNPYFHFNDPNSPCYNNLFQDFDNPDQEDQDWLQRILDDNDDFSEDDADDDDIDFSDDSDFFDSDYYNDDDDDDDE